MDAYEQVNASFGQFAQDTLTASTKALKSTDETHYNSVEDSITSLTGQRDALVGTVRAALNAAAFNGTRDQRLAGRQPGRLRPTA